MADNENITIEQIIKSIPHRYPFLLIDRVKTVSYGQEIIAIKNVTFNEPFFNGHFPDHPIMPGVLIVEAMAQAGTLMVTLEPNFKAEEKLVYFMSIDVAKFRKPVTPGDTLEIHVKKIMQKGSIWKLDGVAYVDGLKVSEAKMTAMIVDK